MAINFDKDKFMSKLNDGQKKTPFFSEPKDNKISCTFTLKPSNKKTLFNIASKSNLSQSELLDKLIESLETNYEV